MSLNLEILEILMKCEFPFSSYRNFVGITRTELRSLSLVVLEARLMTYLSSSPAPTRPSLVARFISALFEPQGRTRGQGHSSNPEPIKIKQEVKQEPADSSSTSSSIDDLENGRNALVRVENSQDQNNEADQDGSRENQPPAGHGVVSVTQPDLPDPDVEIVDEVVNVAIIRVVDAETKAKERIVHVTLQDDEDIATQQVDPPHLPSESGSTSSAEAHPGEDSSTSSNPLRRSSRKRKGEMQPQPLPSGSNSSQGGMKLKKTSTPAQPNAPKMKANITVIKPVDDSTSAGPSQVDKSKFTLGRSSSAGEGSLRCHEWTQSDWKNLASQASVLETLNIRSNCNYIPGPNPLHATGLSFPNLTTLRISHYIKESEDQDSMSSIEINYSQQLREIILGSPSLLGIGINHRDEKTLKSILRVPRSIPKLPSLCNIYIGHCLTKSLTTLRPSELIALGQIKAPNLISLHLGSCIWADGDGTEVQVALQKMLSNFPKLAFFTISGCFVTLTKPWPKIILDFSKLSRLRELELGTGCTHSSIFETVEERPKKANWKTLIINSDPRQIEPNPQKMLSIVLPEDPIEDQDQREEYFPVSINFHGPMPSLISVSMGVLYEVKSFNFSMLPDLRVFRVESQWTQSYPDYFQAPTSRPGKQDLFQASKVRELQFPDSFEECSMITKILRHFPNLTHVYINLPTVKFLRAFAKTMQLTGPKSFEHLTIQIRFDFASSLDSCILDKIQSPSLIEREQLKILKSYPHWEDYVLENQIELPPDNIDGEDGNKFCGLNLLFKQLKTLRIRHIPRTLRIPKGPRHWIDDPNPQFTDTLLGFKEYPFHTAVQKMCPSTMEIICQDFDMSEITDDFRVKPFNNADGKVELNLKTSSIKRELKVEKN